MTRFIFVKKLALVAAVFSVLSGCATSPSGPVSVDKTVAANPQLSTLNQLLKTAGLTDTLNGAGPFTLFAPSNEAFKAVPAKTMEELSKDPAKLKAVLLHHVVPAKAMAADVKVGNVKTAGGTDLPLAKAGKLVTVDDAIVQQPDLVATNGVVHIVDRVLMPPVRR